MDLITSAGAAVLALLFAKFLIIEVIRADTAIRAELAIRRHGERRRLLEERAADFDSGQASAIASWHPEPPL